MPLAGNAFINSEKARSEKNEIALRINYQRAGVDKAVDPEKAREWASGRRRTASTVETRLVAARHHGGVAHQRRSQHGVDCAPRPECRANERWIAAARLGLGTVTISMVTESPLKDYWFSLT